jgi:lysophospholipase L1-like esterase
MKPPTPDDPAAPPPSPKPRRRRRWVVRLAVVALLAFVAGELFARFYLGLGDPPLSQADPEIEYLFKPDQNCRRFGRHIQYNHYSMRSDDFPAHKTDPNELRVLVVGDSIVNGGVLTDQAEVGTALLQRRLAADLKRPVVVGNVSAGSWGPPNELAYLKRFGLFDADVVVIVLSSHDASDAPTFAPTVDVDPAFPGHKPPLALWDGFSRYVLPKLTKTAASNEGFIATSQPAGGADVDTCMAALRQMIEMTRAAGAKVIVAQHRGLTELAKPDPGYESIAREARRDGVEPLDLGPAFDAAGRPYRDDLHPNPAGQKVLAEALTAAVESAVRTGK